MSDSSRETSPDPITLPSSPLSGRKPKASRSARKPTPARVTRSRATPAKSIVLDTPQAGDASPWRIKVTVQAEPRDGSPGKKTTKTMSLPLRSPSSQRKSSSPSKKAARDGAARRPTRKRKGTPIRERRSAPALRSEAQSQQQVVQAEVEAEPMIEDIQVTPPETNTPPRRASGRMARLSAQWSNGTGRTKRLSVAREELDQALQDAIGPYGDAPGDVTLSRAEDFTMVSMESLQSAKEASLAHISHMHAIPEGVGSNLDKSTQSVSYLPSSPPKDRYPDISASAAKARLTLGSPFVPTPQKRSSVRGSCEKKSSAKAQSSLRHEVDAMSWRPTGPAKRSYSPRSARNQHSPTHTPQQDWQQAAHPVDTQVQDDSSDEDEILYDATPEQSEDERGDDDDVEGDVWHTEASREHVQQPEQEEADIDEHQDPDFRPSRSPSEAEDPNYKPPTSQQRPHKFEDLFAHIPEKPLRPKIPRTWRRSSGMDFSYIDSPAHQAPTNIERRQSHEGSGVLTPPSTDESQEIEEDNVTAELQDEADDQLRSEYTQVDAEEDVHATAEMQEEADNQMQSEFTQPEAEATRFHDEDGMDTDDEDDEGNDGARMRSRTPAQDDAESSQGEDDSGSFFANNLPQVFFKERPKRRPPRKPTMDLTELLNLKASPEQAPTAGAETADAETADRRSKTHTGAGKIVGSPLRRSLLKGSKIGETAPVIEQAFNSVRTEDLISNPPQFRHLKELRDSGVKRFDTDGLYPPSKESQQPPPEPAIPQKRRGRQYFGRNHPNNSQTESTVTDSFASKQSDQRQPLEDNAKVPEAQAAQTAQILRTTYTPPIQLSGERPQARSRAGDAVVNAHQQVLPHADTYDEDLGDDEEDYENEESVEAIQSYEENLNLDSPTKIKVKFNDTMTESHGTSSWLRESIRQPPLFNVNAPRQQPRPQDSSPDLNSMLTLVDKEVKSEPGLFSRLSSTFWSAVMRPSNSAEHVSVNHPAPYEAPIVFPASICSQVRSRYGVLPDEFPWTMAHIRTLHRMLNSTMSGRVDSIVPKRGPLPRELESRIDSPQRSIDGYTWTFTRQHAYIAFTFMQILVPRETVEAMKRGEVDVLGDGVARRIRGYFDAKRHGDDEVYHKDWVKALKGQKIFIEFPLSALGDCVKVNDKLWRRLQGEGREDDFERQCFGDALARRLATRAG